MGAVFENDSGDHCGDGDFATVFLLVPIRVLAAAEPRSNGLKVENDTVGEWGDDMGVYEGHRSRTICGECGYLRSTGAEKLFNAASS